MTESEKAQSRKKRSISAFSILLIMLIALAVITVLVGASGGDTGVTGATLSNVATAPVKGFTDALPVCLFVMILGGFLGVVTETGALDTGIAVLVKKLKGNELILIPILMFLFSIGGTTYGMCEETVPFCVLLAATMVAAGFDSLVGVATVLLGAGVGVLGSTVNPFAVGAAVDALSKSDIEINQGVIIALGAVLWIVSLIIAIAFVMSYAKKVKADKGSTILSLQEQEVMNKEYAQAENEAEAQEDPKLTGRQKWTLLIFAFTFAVMVIGFIPWGDFNVNFFSEGEEIAEITAPIDAAGVMDTWNDSKVGSSLDIENAPDFEAVTTTEETINPGWSAFLTGLPLGQWYFDEGSTWFLVMTLIIGIVGGISESRFVKSFIAGAGDMMSVVLVIALARSVTVLMGTTGMDQWILNNAANFLSGVSAVIFAPLSYLLYLGLSFLIPSSSGMATVSMPIMGPLAHQLGFSIETMVMIFSAGNGLINLFTPTSGAIMGGLAIARVEYTTWLKFVIKPVLVIGIASVVILTAAMLIF